MDFLNKLYESNYFGIGLFAVISFLVVTFLVVLFFGKKDENKRKLEETNKIRIDDSAENAFKETTVEAPVEVPIAPVQEPTVPVMPINEIPVTPTETIAPINFDSVPVEPVAPINYEESKEVEDIQFVDNLMVEEPVVIPEPVIPTAPIELEPINFEMPVEPKVMEPVKISIPEELIKIEPIIKEEVTPIITPMSEVIPTIVEPVINETYYEPVEPAEEEIEEIQVPNIDFDALAESISKELDELEKNTNTYKKEEVKAAPTYETNVKPQNQFSSVFVSEQIKQVNKPVIDLPKKIELPTLKSEEIEPESYSI